MKLISFLLVALIAASAGWLGSPMPALADSAPVTITTQGRAVQRAKPEKVVLQFGLVASGDTLATTKAAMQPQADVLDKVLASVGVTGADVQTHRAQWVEFDSLSTRKVKTHYASRTVVALLRDPDQLADLIASCLEFNLNNIEDIRYVLPQLRELREKALGEAYKDALGEMQRIARQSSVELKPQFPPKETVLMRFMAPKAFDINPTGRGYAARTAEVISESRSFFSTAVPVVRPTATDVLTAVDLSTTSFLSDDGEFNLGRFVIEATVELKSDLKK